MKPIKPTAFAALCLAAMPLAVSAGDQISRPTGWTDARPYAEAEIVLVSSHMKQGQMAMPTDGETYTLGDLEISTPFARATMPNAPVAGGFLTITNSGSEDDRLVAAASEAAARMEIHEMAMEGDVMKMRELENGLPIPAGETVMLQPGGYHVMFMDLAGPLNEGETVSVTLTFEKSGEVEIVMPVMARMGKGGHGRGMASE